MAIPLGFTVSQIESRTIGKKAVSISIARNRHLSSGKVLVGLKR